ncbi:protein of unknown function (DUF3425) domain containing protein [Rhypophila sp. PSN 637]
MSRTNRPPISSAPPRIQLVAMPQLAEAITRRDDWTGTTNAAARRRAQTRLNTRAYRKRKAQKVKEASWEASSTALAIASSTSVESLGPRTMTPATTAAKVEPSVPYWDDTQQSILRLPISQKTRIYNPRAPLLQPATPAEPSNTKTNPKIIFPLSQDHLITLLQFNALRALSVNRTFLSGILTTPLDCAIEVPNHIIPFPSPERKSQIPPSLLPTKLQQEIPHPDWIDLFPLPSGRDSLILASLAGGFDEDDLWADCIGGLYEGYPDDEMERRGFIAWSPPWDISGWEMSEGFLRKWGRRLFRDGGVLEDMLQATNRWRVGRGEERICVQVVEEEEEVV